MRKFLVSMNPLFAFELTAALGATHVKSLQVRSEDYWPAHSGHSFFGNWMYIAARRKLLVRHVLLDSNVGDDEVFVSAIWKQI